MNNERKMTQEREWTLWSDQRPPNAAGSYRYRATFDLLGVTVSPEWEEKMTLCGMGYSDSEWWPLSSCHWDGYQRRITIANLEWSPVLADDPEGIVWNGLDLLPCPFTGAIPKVEAQGRYIGAPLWHSEALWISSPFVPKRRWTDAKAMLTAWNTRIAAQSEREAVDAVEAFEMGRLWQQMLQGQTLEDSRAIGRTLGSDIFKSIHARLAAAEKEIGFNPFADSDTGIFQAIKIIHAALTTPAPAVSQPEREAERFLTAYVSQDGKVIGIEHETVADWNEVRAAHVALRDRINERLAEEDNCPFKPDVVQPEREAVLEEARRVLVQNKRVNDAIQTALERRELIISDEGYLAALTTPAPAVSTDAEPLPVEYYLWLASIEPDVRVRDLTAAEVADLLSRIRGEGK